MPVLDIDNIDQAIANVAIDHPLLLSSTRKDPEG
jgi:hypothetical protein